MSEFFVSLRRRVEVNARRAVEAYAREVPEYRSALSGPLPPATVLDFAGFLRQLVLDRAEEDRPLSRDDLASIAAVGRRRGEVGLSLGSQRRVTSLHTSLMLREVTEVATPGNTDEVLHLTAWLGREGARASDSYLGGFHAGVGQSWSAPAKAGLLARMLVADEPVAVGVAGQVGVRLADHYLVTVLRAAPPPLPDPQRDRIVATVWERGKAPATWLEPDELVIVVPTATDGPVVLGGGVVVGQLRERALDLLRRAAAALDRPCAVGAAAGPVGALAAPLELAREISRATPPEAVPHDLYTVADRFVELSVARAPQVDAWLQDVVKQVDAGPDLVATLDAYYRHDMSRTATAAALGIHGRTLDYRLQRVQVLTGLRPASTRGVRVLTAAITRALAGDRG